MNKNLLIVGLLILGFVGILSTFLMTTTQSQTKKVEKKQKSDEDITVVVKRGQTTNEERAYSKEYNELYPNREKNKLSEVRKEIKNLGIMLEVIGDFVEIPDLPPITSAEFLNDLSCSSDSIVTGTVISKKAHLSEDETYVYTEYEFSTEDVLKNNSSSSIENNGKIKITRPGGVIKLEDRIITVSDERFDSLQLKKRYLLFLRFVPATNGYMAIIPNSDFIFETNSFKRVSKNPTFNELRNGNNIDLLKKVRESVSVDCKKTSKGGN